MNTDQHQGARPTACVTGASSGIGRAIAVRLAELGYDLIVTGRQEARLTELAREVATSYDRTTSIVIGDLREPAACTTLIDTLTSTEQLEVLVHNAGYGHRDGFLATPTHEIREMGEVHMQCTAALIREVYPLIAAGPHFGALGGPAIVAVASMAAFIPVPVPAIYTASKAFMVALVKALHPQAARDGVRMVVLCPGFTHSTFHDRLDWSAERRRNQGLVRWMTSEEVARRTVERLRAHPGRNPVYVPGLSNRILLAVVRRIPWLLYRRMAVRVEW